MLCLRSHDGRRLCRTAGGGALRILPVLLTAVAAAADDRELLGAGNADPYVFILFDVSGSMNWQPGGDAWAPAGGDDPAAKFYQAKSALFEVLTDPGLAGIRWGFATYNQDSLLAMRKHWLYTPTASPPWISDLPYPKPGDTKFFGDLCMDGVDADTSCDLPPAQTPSSCGRRKDVDVPEQWGELLSYPMLGDDGDAETTEWVRHDGRIFEVEWERAGGELGDDTIQVEVRVQEWRSNCSRRVGSERRATVGFERVFTADTTGQPLPGPNDFLFWQLDAGSDASGQPNGFYGLFDTSAGNTCAGWEPNDDATLDSVAGVSLKHPTVDDPVARHPTALDRGDVVPFDWRDAEVWGTTNRDVILRRLAPNFDPAGLCDEADPDCVPGADPEFRVAPYFEDHPDTLFNGHLTLLAPFEDQPPLVPNGATPIGNSMRDLLEWFDDWKAAAADPENGDAQLGCRPINLLILTDGDETCYDDDDGDGDPATGTTDGDGDANPCWLAQRLLEENERGIRTYVVGFGVQGADANFLQCIADHGGTGVEDGGPGPILPEDRDALVEALQQVLTSIRSAAASFAAASVPAAQVGVEDKIFLASFRPVPELAAPPVPAAIWEGHLDAFLRPLPLTEEGLPDRGRSCGGDVESACHLWDAGAAMLDQSPTLAEIAACDADDPSPCRLGERPEERRVYYPQALAPGVPAGRRLLLPAAAGADQIDLWEGMGLAGDPEAATRADEAIRFALRQKTATLETEAGQEEITYILGDIFHSTPLFVGGPRRFDYFVADVGGSGRACDDEGEPDGGYRCFFRKHEQRRRMVLAGSDDGELHAFDAGTFAGTVVDGVVEGEFGNGTGRELFAVVPRAALATLERFASAPGHDWGVDGGLQVDDVRIDPLHAGVPAPEEREWRTVAVGGMREGGRGIFAVDITQPDELDADGLPRAAAGDVPSCHGGPAGNAQPAGCGPIPFPSILWELADTRDEDGNAGAGEPGYDMADSWSVPNTGRIRVCIGPRCDPQEQPNDVEDRYVAVVGGGLDSGYWDKQVPPAGLFPAEPNGNWLYLIDLETGKPLYKRRVVGSAPGEPAAVDTDRDGYLDTVYLGTTQGYVYKAAVGTPAPLVEVLLPDASVESRVIDPAWDPFPVFRATDSAGRGMPIFYPPTVIFVALRNRFALAFGTGDREDLWATRGQEGRFFLILDEGFTAADVGAGGLPLGEASYAEVPRVGAETQGADVLLSPPAGKRPGWFMRLDPEERAIAPAFALSGVTSFTSFLPESRVEGEGGEAVCSQGGVSRIFVVFTQSGNALITEEGQKTRFWTVEGLVTEPYTELSVTGNAAGDPGGDVPPELADITETLKGIFPPNCEFANYTIDLKTLRSDTGVFFIAPVPVCLVAKNWKEF